jgi:hypothetical protein
MRCLLVIALVVGVGGCGTIALPDGGSEPVIGRGCAADADCGAGYQCYLAAPGGYCQLAEPNDCTTDADCPADTVCAPRMASERLGRCLRSCAAAIDCRQGYFCNVEWLFPGEPTSPQSSQPVCWIPCVPGMDWLCNDSPIISSIHGTCGADGSCTCSYGAMNPLTGRCP